MGASVTLATRSRASMAVLGVTLAMVAAGTVAAGSVAAKEKPLRLEISEIGSRFRLDEEHRDENGLPTRGNTFLVEGYIYPEGTLSCESFVCNGVIYDEAGTPSPEFPDKVIGTWICYGAHLEDAAVPNSGPVAISTQVIDLGDMPGVTTIVTSGYEGRPDVEMMRAITGGTGPYAGASGEQRQRVLGTNNFDLFHDGQSWAGVTLWMELRP